MMALHQASPQIHALFPDKIPSWSGVMFVDIGADALKLLEQFK